MCARCPPESRTAERRALRARLERDGVPGDEVREELDRRYPPYPVNHYFVRSLTHESTRVVEMDQVGGITGDYLMEEQPATQEEVEQVRLRVQELIPSAVSVTATSIQTLTARTIGVSIGAVGVGGERP